MNRIYYLLEVVKGEGINEELRIRLDNGRVRSDSFDYVKAELLDPPDLPVTTRKAGRNDVPLPHGICGGVKTHTEEAVLVAADLIIPVHEASPEHTKPLDILMTS